MIVSIRLLLPRAEESLVSLEMEPPYVHHNLTCPGVELFGVRPKHLVTYGPRQALTLIIARPGLV
jgi:hypothetical protein